MLRTATKPLTGSLGLFRALGDETRLRLLELLRDGEQCVCDLTEALDVSQSLLSFHLKTLKDVGLVADRREGRWVYYSLSPDAVAALVGAVSEIRPARRSLRVRRRCD